MCIYIYIYIYIYVYVTHLLVYTSTPAGQGRVINLDFPILACGATFIYV
jgi:hypothetical protein